MTLKLIRVEKFQCRLHANIKNVIALKIYADYANEVATLLSVN